VLGVPPPGRDAGRGGEDRQMALLINRVIDESRGQIF
jgi:hypothetical protein